MIKGNVRDLFVRWNQRKYTLFINVSITFIRCPKVKIPLIYLTSIKKSNCKSPRSQWNTINMNKKGKDVFLDFASGLCRWGKGMCLWCWSLSTVLCNTDTCEGLAGGQVEIVEVEGWREHKSARNQTTHGSGLKREKSFNSPFFWYFPFIFCASDLNFHNANAFETTQSIPWCIANDVITSNTL